MTNNCNRFGMKVRNAYVKATQPTQYPIANKMEEVVEQIKNQNYALGAALVLVSNIMAEWKPTWRYDPALPGFELSILDQPTGIYVVYAFSDNNGTADIICNP